MNNGAANCKDPHFTDPGKHWDSCVADKLFDGAENVAGSKREAFSTLIEEARHLSGALKRLFVDRSRTKPMAAVLRDMAAESAPWHMAVREFCPKDAPAGTAGEMIMAMRKALDGAAMRLDQAHALEDMVQGKVRPPEAEPTVEMPAPGDEREILPMHA